MNFEDVEFTNPDLQSRAAGRLLWQFRRSPLLLAILYGLVSEIQVLMDACIEVQQMRIPFRARGENLNAIGRIVGQNRILLDYSELPWFTPDKDGYAVDQALVWVTGAPLYENGVANDTLYRMLIQAKVYRNFCRYGSIPEIQEAVSEAFGVAISMQRAGGLPFNATLIVPSDIPLYVLGFLMRCTSTKRADSEYLPPYPATLRIDGVMFDLDPTFTPDVEDYGADEGYATVIFDFS